MPKFFLLILFVSIFLPATALAGDGVTLIFKSGQVVKMKAGYEKIISQVKSQSGKISPSSFIELNIEGETLLVNLDGIALVCRDNCSSAEVTHQQDPARGQPRR